MPDIQEIFGTMVFSDKVMRERLPSETYAAVQRTMRSGRRLHPDTAEVVAAAMKAILTAIFIVFMRLFDKDRFSCNIFFSPEGV